MNIGNIQQKANRALVVFVFFCIIITTVLLYVLEKSQTLADNISPNKVLTQYVE